LMVDANLGEGGHTEAFLERYPELTVLGIEADAEVARVARERFARFGGRVAVEEAWSDDVFADLAGSLRTRLPHMSGHRPCVVLFDLGISSYHFKRAGRGFSFLRDEPLDMRLRPEGAVAAGEMIRSATARELAEMFREYGEERYAGRIAESIVRRRAETPITTSRQLAEIIRGAVPPPYRRGRIHPATRCFQALRIAVNDELGRLERALAGAFDRLAPGGRMGVIAFHSLEDRIVKRFFQQKKKSCTCPPEWPICQCGGRRELRTLTKKPIRPTEAEVGRNAASRSARLRVVEKTTGE